MKMLLSLLVVTGLTFGVAAAQDLSGTNALTFAYPVPSTDHNVSSLAATSINLSGATITDSSGSAVNLSPSQFHLSHLPTVVQRVLHDTGCRPEWLELEITEGLLLVNELPSVRRLGPIVLYALYSFSLTSYFAYLYPVLFGRIRPWMFVLAIGTE